MSEPKRPLKVFLSYASQDKSLVREFSRRLVGEGWIDTWQDEKNLLPGQDWRVKIEEAVEEADVVIIVLSQHSVSKEGHVQKELRYAREIALEKPEDSIFLIPLRLEECEVPQGLRFYQRVDYFGERKNDGYDSLVQSLQVRYEQKLKQEKFRKERKTAEKIAHEKAERESTEKAAVKVPPVNEGKQSNILVPKVDKPESKKIKAPNKGLFSIVVVILVICVSAGFIINLSTQNVFTPQQTSTQTDPNPTAVARTAVAELTLTAASFTATLLPPSTPLPTEIADAKGVSMVLVPAGNFNMGGNTAEMLLGCQKYYSDCQSSVPSVGDTALQVYVEEFYIDKYEVKNSDYKICVDVGVCMPPQKTRSYSRSSYYGNPEFNNYPVIYVDWVMSKTYCEWRDARLPTEAEWEKAARGTNGLKFPWGEGIDCTKANYAQDTYCVGDTTSVGNYPDGKSIYGAYDMAGNVWEWVSSLGIHYPYDVNDGREDLNPTLGPRILRGGAWSNYDFFLSSSYRGYYFPEYGYSYGFRCAGSIP